MPVTVSFSFIGCCTCRKPEASRIESISSQGGARYTRPSLSEIAQRVILVSSLCGEVQTQGIPARIPGVQRLHLYGGVSE